jgi:hypothetical protein
MGQEKGISPIRKEKGISPIIDGQENGMRPIKIPSRIPRVAQHFFIKSAGSYAEAQPAC